jgi:hypothetical protein
MSSNTIGRKRLPSTPSLKKYSDASANRGTCTLQKPWIAVDLQAELAHRPPKTMDPLSPGCGHSGNQLQEKNPETRQNLCGDNSAYISKSQMMMRISSPLEEGLCTNDSPASKLPDLDTPVSSSASRYLPKKKKETHLHTQPEEANLCSQRSNP